MENETSSKQYKHSGIGPHVTIHNTCIKTSYDNQWCDYENSSTGNEESALPTTNL